MQAFYIYLTGLARRNVINSFTKHEWESVLEKKNDRVF